MEEASKERLKKAHRAEGSRSGSENEKIACESGQQTNRHGRSQVGKVDLPIISICGNFSLANLTNKRSQDQQKESNQRPPEERYHKDLDSGAV